MTNKMTAKLMLPHTPPLGWVYYYVSISAIQHTTVEHVLDIMEGLGLEPTLRLQCSMRDDVRPFPVLLFYEGQGDPSEELDQKCKALDDALEALGDGVALRMQHGNGFYEEIEAKKAKQKALVTAA